MTSTDRAITGLRVVLTGASGALGGATAHALRASGAHVVGLARRHEPGTVHCDVTDDASVRSAVAEAIDRLGGLDALVHCAGIGGPGDVGEPDLAAEMATMDVNLWGLWRVTTAALPALVESRGRVVMVSSMLAYVPAPLSAGYSISKRAVSAYADALRAEYGTHLTVTTVYPGHVDTPMHDGPRSLGVSMDGKVPFEQVDDTVRTVLDLLTATDPPRDTGTTHQSQGVLFLARRAPGLAAAIADRRTRELAGELDSPLAKGLVGRLDEEPVGRQDALGAGVIAAGLRRARATGTGIVTMLTSPPRPGHPRPAGYPNAGVVGMAWQALGPLLTGVAAALESAASGVGGERRTEEIDAARGRWTALRGDLLRNVIETVAADATRSREDGPTMLESGVIADGLLRLVRRVESVAQEMLTSAVADGPVPTQERR